MQLQVLVCVGVGSICVYCIGEDCVSTSWVGVLKVGNVGVTWVFPNVLNINRTCDFKKIKISTVYYSKVNSTILTIWWYSLSIPCS